jgi:ribosomal protein L11 methyltransferase
MPHADTHRFVLPVEVAEREVAAARLLALGAHGVWERPGEVVAWFDAPDVEVPDGGRWEVEPDRDWQAEWKADLRPVHAGRVAVVPSWLAAEHEPAPDELTLVLDPGRAFGSGHHATTVLCLELLDELDLEGRTVADVGCGSGVLAIAAARRGARVVAVDVDEAAVEVTRENAARNQAALDVRHGSVEVLDGPVDVLVANLLTDTVAQLAAALAAAGAVLIVSGITAERRQVALDALRAAGAELEDVRERDGWIAVKGRGVPA